jgi:predicted transcriptional regulator
VGRNQPRRMLDTSPLVVVTARLRRDTFDSLYQIARHYHIKPSVLIRETLEEVVRRAASKQQAREDQGSSEASPFRSDPRRR